MNVLWTFISVCTWHCKPPIYHGYKENIDKTVEVLFITKTVINEKTVYPVAHFTIYWYDN